MIGMILWGRFVFLPGWWVGWFMVVVVCCLLFVVWCSRKPAGRQKNMVKPLASRFVFFFLLFITSCFEVKAVGLLFIVGRGLKMKELELRCWVCGVDGVRSTVFVMHKLTRDQGLPLSIFAACPTLSDFQDFSHTLCYDERGYIILNWHLSDWNAVWGVGDSNRAIDALLYMAVCLSQLAMQSKISYPCSRLSYWWTSSSSDILLDRVILLDLWDLSLVIRPALESFKPNDEEQNKLSM